MSSNYQHYITTLPEIDEDLIQEFRDEYGFDKDELPTGTLEEGPGYNEMKGDEFPMKLANFSKKHPETTFIVGREDNAYNFSKLTAKNGVVYLANAKISFEGTSTFNEEQSHMHTMTTVPLNEDLIQTFRERYGFNDIDLPTGSIEDGFIFDDVSSKGLTSKLSEFSKLHPETTFIVECDNGDFHEYDRITAKNGDISLSGGIIIVEENSYSLDSKDNKWKKL